MTQIEHLTKCEIHAEQDDVTVKVNIWIQNVQHKADEKSTKTEEVQPNNQLKDTAQTENETVRQVYKTLP